MKGADMARMSSLTLAFAALALIRAATGAEFTVSAQAVRDPKPVFATIESSDVVAARARIGGIIADLTVQEGDIVGLGQVIATVGDEKLASQMAALKAEADQATADLERARDLARRGVISKAQLDAAEAAASAANSRLASQRQLMAEGAILSPRAGRVLKVSVTSGGVVMPGESVATIADETYVLRLRLPERHARFLKAGDSIRISLNASGGPDTAGTIVLVYPQIEDGRVVADARVEGLGQYFVGQRVEVLISSEERSALVVPADYVRTHYGVDYVLAKQADGHTAEVPVQPGQTIALPDGAPGVEILSGLTAGDVLVQP